MCVHNGKGKSYIVPTINIFLREGIPVYQNPGRTGTDIFRFPFYGQPQGLRTPVRVVIAIYILKFNNQWEISVPRIALIYTTNAVEAYHRMVRKFTKTKSIFPTDDSIRKVVFLSAKEITKKWTQPSRDWAIVTVNKNSPKKGRIFPQLDKKIIGYSLVLSSLSFASCSFIL